MKLAVISDVHGNLEALKQVLADIDQTGADLTVCLGDNVGYGPEPEAVINLLREHEIPSVLGNHELAIARPEYLSWFNELAHRSLVLTRNCLSESAVEYCRGLPVRMALAGGLFVHGCPPDSPLIYLAELKEAELKTVFESLEVQICFVGHTHILELVGYDGREVTRSGLATGLINLNPEGKYLINAGSVGQPRERNKNAKYLLWDTDRATIEARFIPYDVAKTANRIIELGWPVQHAQRLW
ncbi:MAG: metallophosphoesterase family protein [Thermodesulfobacteriota bacterium]